MQTEMLRARLDDNRTRLYLEAADYREAIALMNGGWKTRAKSLQPVRESLTEIRESDSAATVQCKEYLAELEAQLRTEDIGWLELGAQRWEFSPWAHQRIMALCRLYWIKNPLIHCGIEHSAHYVFARGFQVSSPDDVANEVLRKFFLDPRNRAEIGQAALVRAEVKYHTDGNLFWSLHTDPSDGQTIVRIIEAGEIEEIISDPSDAGTPWFYRRRWYEGGFSPATGPTGPTLRDGWYVALGAIDVPEVKQAKTIRGVDVVTDKAGNQIPVYHRAAPAIAKNVFGIPPAYGAIDWARAITVYMTDWCTVHRQLSRIVQVLETQGGAPAMAAWKQALQTTLATNSGSDRNPPPVTASALITGPTDRLTNLKASGMTDSPEAARRLVLMVAAHFGLPETFFGDASVGSLATAQSLDQPTRLKFMERQECWREDLQVMGHYALMMSLRTANGRLRNAIKERGLDPANISIMMTPRRDPHAKDVTWVYEALKPKRKTPATEITIDCKFPEIIDNDLAVRISAIVSAMTLNGRQVIGIPKRVGLGLLLSELGVEDVDSILADWDKEQEQIDAEPPPPVPPVAPQIDPTTGQPTSGAGAAAVPAAVPPMAEALLDLAAAATKAANGHA